MPSGLIRSYFEALKDYLTTPDSPVGFYFDNNTLLWACKADGVGDRGTTQFGRPLLEANI